MRMRPSQSTVMNRNVGSTSSLTTVKVPAALTAFGEDEAGDLYLAIAGSTGYGGSVDEIWVLDGPRGQPDLLFANGFE
mgnify:CR=1 FL=1